MTQHNPTRHNLPVALLLTAVLLIAPAAQAGATFVDRTGPRTPPRTQPFRVCPIDWRKGPGYVRRLIVCSASHYRVPGGYAKAVAIASRESRLHPRAYNRSSGALGIYQHLRRYWPGRAQAYGFRGWSGFNARANVIVTMKMVKRLGSWWPWGG